VTENGVAGRSARLCSCITRICDTEIEFPHAFIYIDIHYKDGKGERDEERDVQYVTEKCEDGSAVIVLRVYVTSKYWFLF
jgi:hypothetical protein